MHYTIFANCSKFHRFHQLFNLEVFIRTEAQKNEHPELNSRQEKGLRSVSVPRMRSCYRPRSAPVPFGPQYAELAPVEWPLRGGGGDLSLLQLVTKTADPYGAPRKSKSQSWIETLEVTVKLKSRALHFRHGVALDLDLKTRRFNTSNEE